MVIAPSTGEMQREHIA